jgi:hypothetical protein
LKPVFAFFRKPGGFARVLPLIPGSDVVFTVLAPGGLLLILSGLQCIFMKLALSFFLVLLLLRKFFLPFLKIKVRFSQYMPPEK